jgi:uncharacterized membrane protein YeaQ/YmgE (transglycosylase-associated protein family)
MGLGALIVMLLVGALAGWIAGKLVTGYGFGLWGNMAVGILGAVLAGAVLPRMGLGHGGGMLSGFVRAVIGAALLLGLIRLFKKV